MKDDDDQEDPSFSAITRYPCMPSLVALQQMRNRLHLAFVGKKLMKWTAQATGRELRKLALDLIQSCKYGEDMKDAFILLARARYFYPNLNKMVLEHIGYAANIKVDITTKSISGVKVLHMELKDTGEDTYQHLGIDRGGQAILAAKVAWRRMLVDVIRFLEQREAFQQLDVAHRSATKKKNVLVKIIIPKLKRTIKFILSELEEVDREEIFRLKRFKQLKSKYEKKPETHICSCCLSMFDSEEEDEVESTCPGCKKAAKLTGKQSIIIRPIVYPRKRVQAQENENVTLLDLLMSHIDGVIDLAKQYKLEGIVPAGIDKFIKTCSQIKETIEDYANAPTRCELCNKTLEATNSGVQLAFKMPSSKSLNVPSAPKMTTEKTPASTESCFNLSTDNDDKLGYFENKFKEIVKVTRLQNADGSVSVEKQVITIRTERRMPKKNDTSDSKTNGPGGGGGGRGGRQNYSSGIDYSGGTDYGGDGGPDYSTRPRETKSESNNRSHQMGETKLRSCMSTSNPKSTKIKDASTNFNSSSKNSNLTIPDGTDLETSEPLPKESSIDSVHRKASICGCPQETGPSDQKSSLLLTSASAHAIIKEILAIKSMRDQDSCPIPTATEDRIHPCDKSDKFKTTSTNAVWRDVCTSTTGLGAEHSCTPNQGPSRPASKPSTKKSSPVSSSFVTDSVESTEKPQKAGKCCTIKMSRPTSKPSTKKSSPVSSSSSTDSAENTEKPQKAGKCCTIKIIPKPPKETPKEPEKEVYLPGSMFETIKRIFLPPTRSNESCKVDPNPPKEPVKKAENRNICSDCLSKLSSFATVKPSIVSESSSCKLCQTSKTEIEETNLCKSCQSAKPSIKSQSSACEKCQACMTQAEKSPSCSSIAQVSSTSCKSLGIGSSTHICMKPSTPSVHSQKHTCCLEKSTDSDEKTCCALAQTKSSSTCCSKKKSSSTCCLAKSKSEKSTKSASGSCNAKTDATTCTKRSARFDVRPLRRHTCEKINLGACTCRSDPHANRNTVRKPVKRCQSFYEDDYYYFKW